MIIAPKPLRERKMLQGPKRQRGFIMNPFAFGAPGAWRTIFDLTVSGGSGGWESYTLRHVFTAALLGGSATKARFTFHGNNAVNCAVNQVYAQIAAASGDVYDYASTPIAVTVGGGTSFAITSGADVVSDDIVISIGASDALVVAAAFPSSPGSALSTYTTTPTGYTAYYKLASDAATVNASSYSASGGGVLVRKLELFG